jgi:hypothetical protein
VAGLSVLAMAYTLRSENNDTGFAASAHEQELQQETDRLRKTVESLNAGLNRIGSNPNRFAGAPPTVNPAPQSMAQTAAAASLTPEQNAFVEDIQLRFNDPSFVRTLNLSELNQRREIKALPRPIQEAILNKAIEKYNRGEVDEKTFLSGMAGLPQ